MPDARIIQGDVREPLKAPFPYFGGKSRIATMVWERFGDVPHFIEPFFGSGAVLLRRPHDPRTETANDKDYFVANFWRAMQADPEGVAAYADWPINEADLHARHLWLVNEGVKLIEPVNSDPEFYDAKVAGWWAWGLSCWIGSGWCKGGREGTRPEINAAKGVHSVWNQIPILTQTQGTISKGVHIKPPNLTSGHGHGTGVHSKRPHMATEKGVNSQTPRLTATQEVNQKRPDLNNYANKGGAERNLVNWFLSLASRLRRVRICCGDWKRVCTPAVIFNESPTAVFLDPPYSSERDENLYGTDSMTVAHDVREWCLEYGNDKRLLIALCGYEGEHAMPDTWECVAWKAPGGYGNQGNGRGKANAGRERIWFSPHCLKAKQASLF